MSRQLKELLEIVAARPLLTRKDIARRYGIDLRSVDRWHREGVLPAAVYLPGTRIPMWRPIDIHEREKHTAL